MDVTKAMERLKAKLLEAFKSKRLRERLCSDCHGGLVPRFYQAGNGWDICELAWNKHLFCSKDCCTGANCNESVRINGECWKAHHVNYWLWGFLQKQCGFSIKDDPVLIGLYRAGATRGGTVEGVDSAGRICWAIAGYNDSLKGSTPGDGCLSHALKCEDCGTEYAGEMTATIRFSTPFGDQIDQMYRVRHGQHSWVFSVGRIRNAEGKPDQNYPVRDCNLR